MEQQTIEPQTMIDLHCHSSASDGIYDPASLVKKAKSIGLTTMALTDHDTINGIAIAKATGQDVGITIISGIELSCDFPNNELHIVGLFIDENNRDFIELSKKLQEYRLNRNKMLLNHFANLGINITEEELTNNNKTMDSVGRPNFARILVQKGYAKNTYVAFEKYLTNAKIPDVHRQKIKNYEAINMIHNAGGLAILAHPHELGAKTHDELIDIIKDLSEKGLDGMEVYYHGYKKARIKEYKKIAHKYGLLISGGSDFHGEDKGATNILGHFGAKKFIPPEILDVMYKKIKHISY